MMIHLIKNKLILFVAIILLPVFSFSQADIKISPPYKVIDASVKEYFSNGNEILTIKIEKNRVYLQKLDAVSLKFIKITEYEDMPDNYALEKIVEFNNKYYIFYSLWDRTNEL